MGNLFSQECINPETYFPGKTITESGIEFAPFEHYEPVLVSGIYDGRAYFHMDNGEDLLCHVPYREYDTVGFEPLKNVTITKVQRVVKTHRWLGFDFDVEIYYLFTDSNNIQHRLPMYGLYISQ